MGPPHASQGPIWKPVPSSNMHVFAKNSNNQQKQRLPSTKELRHPAIHPSIHASMHPCIHASMHPCIHASMHPCINPSIDLPTGLSVYPATYPSICLSIRPIYRYIDLSTYLSFYQYMYLSIHTYIYIYTYSFISMYIHLLIHLSFS